MNLMACVSGFDTDKEQELETSFVTMQNAYYIGIDQNSSLGFMNEHLGFVNSTLTFHECVVCRKARR